MALALGFFFLFVCYTFAGIAVPTIIGALYDGSMEPTEMLTTPTGQNVFRIKQIVSAIFIWGLSATFWGVYTGGFGRRLGLNRRTWWGFFPLSALIVLIAFPFVQQLIIPAGSFNLPESMQGFEEWARETEKSTKEIYTLLLGNFSNGAILGNFLAVAVVPAIVEELFFRGFLVGAIRRVANPHVAVWVGALVFSLFHFQFYGFFSRLFLGAFLGYLFLYAGNLWPSILAHFLHNAITLTIYLLALRGTLDAGILEDDFAFGWAVSLCSACITFLLLYLYSRHSKNRNTRLSYE